MTTSLPVVTAIKFWEKSPADDLNLRFSVRLYFKPKRGSKDDSPKEV